MPSSPAYEQRLVVFLDFLGFREHIERSVHEPDHVGRIANALDTVRRFTEKEDEYAQSAQVTQFSDCVVISYAVGQPSAVFDLLNDIALLQVELAGKGFLVRGGITVGDLIHEPDQVFGPALVEAHRLESAVAGSPRVLVDPVLVDIAKKHPAMHHDGETEARYAESFLMADEDGHRYIDYVSYNGVLGIGVESDLYPSYLQEIAIVLRRGLQSKDVGVLRKMLWLYERYDAGIRWFFEPPRNAEILARHADFYEALESLPPLRSEATAAQELVRANGA